mgnify:CR=1 FL=1
MRKRTVLGLFAGLAAIVLLTVSCDQLIGKEEDDDTGSGNIVTERTSAVIGFGYDVSGKYANSQQIKSAVLDHDALLRAGQIKRDLNILYSEFSTISGTEIHSYQEHLATDIIVGVSVGVPSAASFSAEVGNRFDKTQYESSSYAFATSTSRINKDAYYVVDKKSPASLKNYISSGFAADLVALNADLLIDKYGTHVMLGGIWGARLDYSITAKKKTGQTGKSIGNYVKVSAEATIKGVQLGVTNSTAVKTSFAEEFETSSLDHKTIAYGGDAEYAQAVHDSFDYSKWIDSIDANPVWFDYYNESLQPIYEFITDETKKAEVKAAFDAYLDGKKIQVTSDAPVLKEMTLTPLNQSHFGFTSLISNGNDGDIGSGNGKNTYYELVIALSSNSKKIIADCKLSVWELNGTFNTRYEGTEKFEFTTDKTIADIVGTKVYTLSGHYIKQVRKETIELTGNNACPFLTRLVIGLDSPSLDDKSSIGLEADFKIPYGYWE